MKITKGSLVLRDYEERDIEDEVRWFTTETGWQSLDTPWVPPEDTAPDSLRADMKGYFLMSVKTPERILRPRLEIEWEGVHVGFVTSYFLNEDYEEDDDVFAPRDGKKWAVGIEICESGYRHRGIGEKALSAFMDYLFSHGAKEIAAETWSGNAAMLALASKLGFVEAKRIKGAHTVSGRKVDRVVLARKL